MEGMVSEYPKRPLQHDVGDRAVNVFRYKCPRHWVFNEPQRDYGWDILVTIKKDEQVTEDFFAQLKGSDKPNFIDNKKIVSFELKITTVNWLLHKPLPSMLCVCDTGQNGEPIYYVWIQEDINRINESNPNWKAQDYLTFHIPVEQVLDESAHKHVEEYVTKFHEHLKINAAIGNALGTSLGFEESRTLLAFTDEASPIVLRKISSVMSNTGIIDVTKQQDETIISPLSEEDRKRFKKITKSSTALDSFLDEEARKILDELEPEIEKASDAIKARFLNNEGVLALHHRDFETSLACFQKAQGLRPEEPKYVTNSLLAEYLIISSDTYGETIKFGDSWVKKLESVLSENDGFPNANRLKATWLGATKGAKAAEEYLQEKKLWREEPVPTRCELAEIYKDEGNWDKALELLSELEETGEHLIGPYWNLKGSIFLQKAFGNKSRRSSFVVYGPGPSQLNLTCLRKAEECLVRSCEKFALAGFPLISSIAVVNLTVVQRILGKVDDAKHFCRSFLIQHPNNPEVAGALAGCLIAKNEFASTIKYSRIAYEANPANKMAYQNYLISLYQGEDSETLLELVLHRQASGFSDAHEKSLSLALGAIALNEIGEQDKALTQIALMKRDREMFEDATVAEAVISRNNGTSNKDIMGIYREALRIYPDSQILLTHFIHHLDCSSSGDAEELARCIQKIAELRQLLPIEINELGRCYLTLTEYEKAFDVFKSGEKRYPDESRFLYEQAMALSYIGDEEGVYKALNKYLALGKKDYNVLRNFAFSAMETGRLDEAVSVFQRALVKAKNDSERAELHCQLWELKRKGDSPPKDILRHVIQFGETVGDDPAREAQFLMMAFLSPVPKETDSEIEEWNDNIRKRLKQFSQDHPRFPQFRSFKIPADIPDEEKGSHILAQIAEVMLPHHLAAVPLIISSRVVPYPLSFRASLLPGVHSTFDYWTHCVSSKEFSHGVHIWFDFNPMDSELTCLSKRNEVCVDLSALLTLAELGLLDLLPEHFSLIIIARGTKRAIDHELFRLQGPHPIAEAIEKWRLKYRSSIRIRSVAEDDDSTIDDIRYKQGEGGIFFQTERPINKLIGDGIGESAILARELGITLYSDESIIRREALEEYKVNSFCTISLLKQLRIEGRLSERKEAAILCEMIRKNYRVVPFDKDQLNCCLDELIENSKKQDGRLPTKKLLLADNDMGTMLRQFDDPFFKEAWLAEIATSWWLSLLKNENMGNDILVECMEHPCFALSMRTTSGVIGGIKRHEQEDRLAHILGYFLIESCGINSRLIAQAWSAIKSCCARILHHDERKYERTLFVFLPRWALDEVSKMDFTDGDRLNRIIMVTSHLPEEDRLRIDSAIMRLNPSFLRQN